jgi:hypothetical protein
MRQSKKELMRKFVLAFAILLCCSIGLLAQTKQDFTIVNKTGVIINELHVTPHDSDEWGEDILGRDVLDIDQECDIEFHPKEDACL